MTRRRLLAADGAEVIMRPHDWAELDRHTAAEASREAEATAAMFDDDAEADAAAEAQRIGATGERYRAAEAAGQLTLDLDGPTIGGPA